MHLYVVRHGETRWNLEGRLQGQQDSPLTMRGIEQARRYAEILRAELSGAPEVQICSSPLPRARQTASILRELLEVPSTHYSESDLLKERACGSWEGLSWEEIEARDGADARALWHQWHSPVENGGETPAQVHARAKAWLSLPRAPLPTIVVTHGAISRLFRGAYLNLDEARTMALASHMHETIYALIGDSISELEPG